MNDRPADLCMTIPGAPTAKGRPRFSRRSGRAFTPAKTEKAETSLAGRALAILRGRPDQGAGWPSHAPLVVHLRFVLPVPGSWPRWKAEAALTGALHPVSKPDVDNLAKLAKDALNGVLWVDDSQVVQLVTSKTYGANPQTELHVHVLAQASRGAA